MHHVLSLPAVPSWRFPVFGVDPGAATVWAAAFGAVAIVLSAGLGVLTAWLASRGRQEARAAKHEAAAAKLAAESAAYDSRPNGGDSGHDKLTGHMEDLKRHFDGQVEKILGHIAADRIDRRLVDAEHDRRLHRLERHLDGESR